MLIINRYQRMPVLYCITFLLIALSLSIFCPRYSPHIFWRRIAISISNSKSLRIQINDQTKGSSHYRHDSQGPTRFRLYSKRWSPSLSVITASLIEYWEYLLASLHYYVLAWSYLIFRLMLVDYSDVPTTFGIPWHSTGLIAAIKRVLNYLY